MKVLITGGSVAGPALAWALHREGFTPTVLERSPERREAGQNVDIRGLGRDVLKRMGVLDAVKAELTGEAGARFLDHKGRLRAELRPEEGVDSSTAELEILRGKLSGILLDRIADDVEVRYGDFVTAVRQPGGDTVEVDTHLGRSERFDLLVVAEGRSSRTRRMLFSERTRVLDKGVNMAYGTIEREERDSDWWEWLTATGGRTAFVRPDNVGTIRACLTFKSPALGFEDLPVDAQMHILRERFRGAGWQTGRILDGFAARPEEFYAERMAQVIVSRWSNGRVALVGDAAWGSGPTGMGTTLSLVGSHVLAGELGRNRDRPEVAFDRYERLLRRYVDSAQGLGPVKPTAIHPDTAVGVALVNTLYRVAGLKPVRRLAQKTVITNQRHAPVLPEYPKLRG